MRTESETETPGENAMAEGGKDVRRSDTGRATREEEKVGGRARWREEGVRKERRLT